jgi:Family of unknown function (DUF6460)
MTDETQTAPPPETAPPPIAAEPVRRDPLTRFFGGSPFWVLVRLIMLSIVVGVVLAVLDLDVFSLLRGLRELFYEFFDNIWYAVDTVFEWFLLGAVVVFPLWLISRLLKAGTRA